jgi:hypothetical protein
MFRFTAVAVFVFVSIGAPRAIAANPYDDLLKQPSPSTNVLVLIDLKQAYASPLAKKENWVENIRQSGHGGLGFFPVESEFLAIAAEVNLTTMVREHQIGFVKLQNLPNFNTLATREGGSTDDIVGHLSVLSPRNVYFTSFSGGIFAAAYPADRQFVSRWLRANKADKLPPLVPYLQAAADNSKDNTVTIAIDVEDSADAGSLRVGAWRQPRHGKEQGHQPAGPFRVSRACEGHDVFRACVGGRDRSRDRGVHRQHRGVQKSAEGSLPRSDRRLRDRHRGDGPVGGEVHGQNDDAFRVDVGE